MLNKLHTHVFELIKLKTLIATTRPETLAALSQDSDDGRERHLLASRDTAAHWVFQWNSAAPENPSSQKWSYIHRRAILPRFSRSPLHNRGLPVCLPNSSQGLPPSTLGPHAHHPVQADTTDYPLDPGTTASVTPQISVCFPLELALSVWSSLRCTVTILSLPTQQFLIEEVNLLLSYRIPLFTVVALLPPSIVSPHNSPALCSSLSDHRSGPVTSHTPPVPCSSLRVPLPLHLTPLQPHPTHLALPHPSP